MSYQQQLNDAVMRRNTLAQMVDDGKKEISLLEGKVMETTDRATKIQLDYQVRMVIWFDYRKWNFNAIIGKAL